MSARSTDHARTTNAAQGARRVRPPRQDERPSTVTYLEGLDRLQREAERDAARLREVFPSPYGTAVGSDALAVAWLQKERALAEEHCVRMRIARRRECQAAARGWIYVVGLAVAVFVSSCAAFRALFAGDDASALLHALCPLL